MKSKTLVALLLCAMMFIGMLPMSIMAYYEETFPDEGSLEVCTEGKTYSLFTEDGLDDCNGMTFLYVVKSGDRYYTLGNPRYSKFEEVDSVYAVDITEYYDAQTNSFSGISNNVNVGVMQYQHSAGSYMYVDGNMLFALSVPFESKGETWFDGGIRYYSPDETYSYSRPLWHANGDGSGYFYDSYIDWIGDSDVWTYGVLDLKYTGTHYVFSLRDKSEEYNEAKKADPDNYNISVGSYAYLYAAPCGHEQRSHTDADAPTCMEKGCHEYWYCRLCDSYFSDKNMTVAYDGFPEIDALGHDWNGEKCNNCNRPVPVYSKVTNKTDFFALADDTMYVLIAEYEGKYYTPDSSLLYSYVFDLDEDGYADIYNVDENDNGTPDVAEIDWDGNGVYDLWEHQTEEERREYFDSICHGYLTDMLYGQTVGIPVKEITLNPDGTISHDAAKDALEFEMIKLHGEEDDLDYTFECVMQFVVPNTFINSPAFIPEDRPYNKLYPDHGDTYYWAVLFYNDRDSYYTYDWENDEYVDGLPFLDICKEGSIALSKSWNAFSPEFEEQLGCLRLRDYNGKLSFVVGADYALDGSEWVDDENHENGGYYDTNDTQACVYLYASAPYEHSHIHNFVDGKCECGEEDPNYVPPHIHNFVDGKCECGEEDPNYVPPHSCKFGEWVADNGADTHTRRCECGESETLPHDWDNGVITEKPTCDQKGVKTYTCADCGATKTEDIRALGHSYGAWIEDGDNHTHSCTRDNCSKSESQPHRWNSGVITKNPEHTEEGIKTYTCSLCNATKEEKIDKTPDHNFVDGRCECGEEDPNYVPPHEHNFVDGKCECGEEDPNYVPPHEHNFVDGRCECGEEDPNYVPPHEHNFVDGRCECGEEDPNYVPPHEHNFVDGKCECGEEDPNYVPPHEHNFVDGRCECGEEDPNYVPPHEHNFVDGRCKCGEEDPNYVPPHEHNFVDGRCECGEEDPNYVPPHEHKFGDWICEATVVGKHYRLCECGERENGDCQWNDGEITLEPTYDAYGEKTYTCGICNGTKIERIDMLVKVDEIISPDEDVKLTVPEGSSAVLDESTTLEVEEIEEEVPEAVKDNVNSAIGENKETEILATYDIALLLDGANVQPGGLVEVSLPAPANSSAFDSLQVVYIDDNGNVTPCETTVNDDGSITFLTDHFSRYAIVGITEAKVDNPPVGEPEIPLFVWIISLVVGVAIIIGCVVGPFLAKKKAAAGIAAEPDEISDATEPTSDAEKSDDTTEKNEEKTE